MWKTGFQICVTVGEAGITENILNNIQHMEEDG